MLRLSAGCCSLLILADMLSAQVPHGTSVLGVITSVPPGEGLYAADRLGNCTPVTGLFAAGSPNANVNALALDPIDDRIWVSILGINHLGWIRMTGTTVTQFELHGYVPFNPINAITFDDDSRPIVCGGDDATGGVFRFDRKNGGAATLLGRVAGTGRHNALARDSAGNLYVGMFLTGEVHVMAENTNGTFQPPTLFGTVSTGTISSMAFAPARGSSPDELWITTFGGVGSMLFRLPVPSGGVATPVANVLASCNAVDYDRSNDDILVSTQAGPDEFVRVDRATGVATVVCAVQGGNAGILTANDANDAPFATTVVAPMVLAGNLGPFDLELGTTAPPGSLVVIGTQSPTTSVIAIGIAGSDGRLNVALPDLVLGAAMPPGAFEFVTLYLDSTSTPVIGPPVAWPTL